jgi:hypothetical protein
VLIIKPFSDFVEKPIVFEEYRNLLFKTMSSNLSFKVGEEIVYVIHGILTSRCDYFRTMLSGQNFKEAQVPMTVESKIPIKGIDVDVFKMIIEWIYTMDIKSLNDPVSPTLILDLKNVYVAANMYGLSKLCDSVQIISLLPKTLPSCKENWECFFGKGCAALLDIKIGLVQHA